MIETLAGLPRRSSPASEWRYGPSVDIQGYVVEKLSGQGLDVFLKERLFDPLGMVDTGFWVDAFQERPGPSRIHKLCRWRDRRSRAVEHLQ